MKYLFSILLLSLFGFTLSAQKNELSLDASFFENDKINSGLGLSYYFQVSPKHTFGIRPAITFNNNSIQGNQRIWQLDVLSRIQIQSFKSVHTHLDLGLAYLNTHERIYAFFLPEQSIVPYSDIPVNYLGFSVGLSIDKIIFEQFKIGLYCRSNLFFPVEEELEKSAIFRSRPNLFVSYLF